MIRELSLSYSLVNKEKEIKKFIANFHNKVYSEDSRRSNPVYQRFYDNVRGGWSEKIISLRRTLLIREFLDKCPLEELDEKRQITDEEKIAAFERHSKCQCCYYIFKDYKEATYHHKVKHSEGGKSALSNIMVLCNTCHKRVHGKEKIELPGKNEIEESEIEI